MHACKASKQDHALPSQAASSRKTSSAQRAVLPPASAVRHMSRQLAETHSITRTRSLFGLATSTLVRHRFSCTVMMPPDPRAKPQGISTCLHEQCTEPERGEPSTSLRPQYRDSLARSQMLHAPSDTMTNHCICFSTRNRSDS